MNHVHHAPTDHAGMEMAKPKQGTWIAKQRSQQDRKKVLAWTAKSLLWTISTVFRKIKAQQA